MFTLRPVCGDGFVDREELVGEMVTSLSSPAARMGFALVGRRRMGKTSIFLEVIRRLDTAPNVVPIYLSLWDLAEGTLAELTRVLTREALEAFQDKGKLPLSVRARNIISAPLALLRDLLAGVRISVRLREEIEVLVMFARGEAKAEAGELTERAFLLPERLSEETSTRSLLFLDEFPALMEIKHAGETLGEGVMRKLRTMYERMEGTVISISGSARGTMEAVALAPTAAFYRQFVVREVGPLPAAAVAELLTRNLGRPIAAEALDAFFTFTNGIPFYVQFLGRALARRGEEKKPPFSREVTAVEVERAVEELLAEEGGLLFREEWDRLSAKERRVALALAQGHTSPTVIAREIGDTPNVVSRYLLYLEEKGLAERAERGEWWITDPVFARWLSHLTP